MKPEPLTKADRAKALVALAELIEINNRVYEAAVKASHQLALGQTTDGLRSVRQMRLALLLTATSMLDSVMEACAPPIKSKLHVDAAAAGEAVTAMLPAAQRLHDDLSGLLHAIESDPTDEVGVRADAAMTSIAELNRQTEPLRALAWSHRPSGSE
ncbi:MAG: hypothetical protein AAF937_12770 [Planctomycetota bacterium]